MNSVNMCSSRREILKILKKERATVDDLSSQIGISPTAIRQHLTILEGENLVKRERLKEGIGRPKVLYTTTEKAEDFFPKYYSWLTTRMIKEIAQQDGEEKIAVIFNNIGDYFSQPYKERVHGKPLEEQLNQITEILNEWGSYASIEKTETHYLLTTYNCSFYEVALKYPQVCNIHTRFLRNLLNQTPQLTSCMADGNDYCEYIIPLD
jgi:predicted ArsR family transcriptional regulator